MTWLILLAALFVGYANGSNDNFKGVATLYGSRVLSYPKALAWGTLSTLAGAITSFFAGGALLRLFSGKGIVAASAVANPEFILCVAFGAALTVILAPRVPFRDPFLASKAKHK